MIANNNENPYSPPQPIEAPSVRDPQLVQARRIVFWPALLMMAQGGVIVAIYIYLILTVSPNYERDINSRPPNPILVHLPFLLSPLLVWCGRKLMRVESLYWARAGAILALLLFLPVGFFTCIWTFFAIDRPEVKMVWNGRTER